jgi:cell division protein FtsW
MQTAYSPRRPMSPPAPYDRLLIYLVVTLLIFGLLMVASASIVVSDQHLHQPFYFFYRQLIYIIVGAILSFFIMQIQIQTWEKLSGIVLMVTIVMLALVLLPGIGRSINGSARWLGVSFFSIEVSEVAKFAVVVYMASFLVRRHSQVTADFYGFLRPLGLLGVTAVLLLKEPDFGATVVVITTALGMMFMAGMRLRHFVVLALMVLVAMSILAVSAPYRLARLTTFMHPWDNAFKSGYQLTQSLIAFGRGGWFGVGLGQSIQKLFYLPEAHTDFLFAVIGEELGLLGMLFITVIFTALVMRILYIGKRAQELKQHFAGFMAYGFGLWLAFQFTVSVGVNCGILPTKGLTMPLISYGGSSMLITLAVVALLMRIDY